ncbi:hypothetical protein ENUP19_0194G0020 [Entamoeba nuttalli]|uniref:Uncharacterized protein n=2 Tax=Entamoeba nuttalli TaxID=412467 RepID=K2HTU1_ENTNP|nr:hypothetical protein ENU1_123770 [Entamoeba nuttalli P19]EKE39555.1 hypothetical protein ENU1_123770 [Entamoeba nuttalli P19]|eukprot:XP_008858111.1 hypothetical protein ENU1_123770 [Entamoeba nuttalli P19]
MSSSSFKEEIPETPRYIVNKRKLQNYETMQHAILISLLSPFCGFSIKKPRKKAIVRHCMPRLKSLLFENEEIEVIKLADTLCRPIFENEVEKGMNKQTAFRRFEKNKRIFVINLLYDLCLEKGYFFDARQSRKTEKTIRLDRIKRIFFKGRYLMDFDELMEQGELINDYLNRIVSDKRGVIARADKKLMNFTSFNFKKLTTC